LENRDISQLSDEELLSLISKEEITNDEITLNKKHLDITNVMVQYKIEKGNIPISPVLLFKILKFHIKNKIDPDEIFMYLSTILDVDKDGYFLINQRSKDIVYKIFPRDEYSIKWKKEYFDRSKELIHRFIHDLHIRKGKVAVNVQVLYFVFGKWARERKVQTTRFNTFKPIVFKRFEYFNESLKTYLLLDENVVQYITDDIMALYEKFKESQQ
jgi:hypothetical protein